MSPARRLSQLLAAPDGNPVIALRDGEALRLDRLRSDVGGCIDRLPDDARRAALVCDGSYAFVVGLFALLHAGREIVVPVNSQPGTLAELGSHIDILLDDAFIAATDSAEARFIPLDDALPALTFFTSGSTGAPQAVRKSLAMLQREAETLEALWPSRADDGPVYSTVPHQHVYGLMFKLVWPLVTGRAFRDETDKLWETLLSSLQPSATIVSSPAHLSRLSGLPPLPVRSCPARLLSAGAPLPTAAARDARAILGRSPTEIFGSTETGAIAWRDSDAGECAPWQPFPGIATRQNADGCLALRSPYAGEDWVDSADLIEIAANGFHLRGRADRVVKIEGKRISLPAVEQALHGLPWIAAAASVLLPGSPERLAAAVVLNAEGRERLAAIGSFRFSRLLRAALGDTQEPAGQPRVWRFVAELPAHGALAKRRDADVAALFETAP